MKLKVSEILNLESELYGLNATNEKGESQVIFKGLLNQPLSLKTKYHLNRAAKVLTAEKEVYQQTFKEAYEKISDGKDLTDESRKELEDKHRALLNSEVDVELDLSGVSIDDLDVSTEYNYINFLNLLG